VVASDEIILGRVSRIPEGFVATYGDVSPWAPLMEEDVPLRGKQVVLDEARVPTEALL